MNLIKLEKKGFPVPTFWVIKTEVFEDYMGGYRGHINQRLDTLDFSDQDEVASVKEDVLNLLRQQRAFSGLEEDLLKHNDQIFDKDNFVAVRSSVIDEDSAEHSFAGLMSSKLNVRPLEISEAVREVWASAFSARALAYRNKLGIPVNQIKTGVIIQKMIQSSVSGIMFTRDPETKGDECIIVAGYGLGNGVVTNSVETDTFRWHYGSRSVQQVIRKKRTRTVLDTFAQKGTRIEDFPKDAEQETEPALSLEEVEELVELGEKIEEELGCPQDIEWAIDGNGKIWILQARPVVFAKTSDQSPFLRIWDNSNIVESYPGITLPLTFSFIRSAYAHIFRKAVEDVLAFKDPIMRCDHIFKNMLGLLYGRVYYNLYNWYEMLSFLPGFESHKQSWDKMIGIRQKLDFPKNKLGFINNFSSAIITAWKLLTVKRTGNIFFQLVNATLTRFNGVILSGLDEHQLYRHYEKVTSEIGRYWHLTLYNDFAAMKYYDWLKKLSKRWYPNDDVNLCNDLLCGEKDIESIAPVYSLLRIKEIIKGNRTYKDLFDWEDPARIWEAIQNNKKYKHLYDLIRQHLTKYGDRSIEELKLEQPSLREQPSRVISIIKKYQNLNYTEESLIKRERLKRKKAESIVKTDIHNPVKKMVFRFVLHNARQAIAQRENMRFARSRMYGLVRLVFRHLGDRFAANGEISDENDIFYLTIEEIHEYLHGTCVTMDLESLVRIRKREYSSFESLELKERFSTAGVPYRDRPLMYADKVQSDRKIQGVGCSGSLVNGTARVIYDPSKYDKLDNNILVARSTDPAWVFLMLTAKGLVTERGSVLSHTAIIGRELGIPTVIGVKDATRRIPDGTVISVDGKNGTVSWES